MLAIKYTHKATQDLRELYNYSKTKWGIVQTQAYINGLQKTIELISTMPQMGKQSSIDKDYFRFKYQKHYIYY
ncbi:type II toxin-antitoxin system RelE/ParE family toxin [Orbaceae bacterium ac157xtp]